MFRLAQPPHHLSNQHQGGSNVIQMQTDTHRVLGALQHQTSLAREGLVCCLQHHCYRKRYMNYSAKHDCRTKNALTKHCSVDNVFFSAV